MSRNVVHRVWSPAVVGVLLFVFSGAAQVLHLRGDRSAPCGDGGCIAPPTHLDVPLGHGHEAPADDHESDPHDERDCATCIALLTIVSNSLPTACAVTSDLDSCHVVASHRHQVDGLVSHDPRTTRGPPIR